MSTPVTPAPAEPKPEAPAADAAPLLKVSWKTPIVYALAALAALLGFLPGVDAGARTTFQFTGGREFFAIPNAPVPSLLTIVVLTVVMAAAAVWAFLLVRSHRPAPAWLHVVVGLSFVLAFLTYAGSGRTSVIPMVSLLAGALALSVPLVFGALSGVICERSGIINIAIEGQLLFGAFAAAVVASATGTGYAGLVAAPVAGALVGAVLAWFAVSYRVNQIIVGVVLNTLIIGLTGFLFATVLSDNKALWNTRMPLPRIRIPLLSEIPVLGPVLFNQTILVYLMYALIFGLQFMLFRSRWGLRTRAVGEHPKAADTVGIKVNTRRVWNTILGGAIAGLGGAFFTVGSGLAFGREMSAGNGFIALAAMILGKWNPYGAVMAALLFGFSKNLGNVLSTIGSGVPSEILLMLPYVITIFAVAGFVGRVRPPAAEGIPYTKS
ncbi:ABC transporter permease [Ornithinimicrobium humiphilum]|uniref:Nucleoside ABC transporter membrane protein n=1 Tax=Ornithinimicrobium humiphilum TaxID=125288 RepID=A0A543KQS6_9MICO|nr:ABC transporter permease [Ornithinimicrobium humiphilum]TQM97430.1 nucleoside ABC transporter membrane protein [Ornithinimicrobium humiphilum]